MTGMTIVHLVDDDFEIQKSLRLMLKSVAIETRTYGNADEFLAEFVEEPGHRAILLLDVRMPGMSGMSLLAQVREEFPSLPIIMVTGHGDIDMAVRAMKLGAADFITKPFSSQILLDRIQEVTRKLPETVASAERAKQATVRLDTLTTREREIFDRIVAGCSNKKIALDLEIGVRTVESHRANLMEKLKARSLVDLVLLSVDQKNMR